MSGTKGKSGGHNKTPCRWNGNDFRSFQEIDDLLGKTRGTASTYWRSNRKLQGHKVKVCRPGKIYKHSDADLIEFYSFVNARKKLLPDIRLRGMIRLFNER